MFLAGDVLVCKCVMAGGSVPKSVCAKDVSGDLARGF